MKEKIKSYIARNYEFNTPLFTQDIVESFPSVKQGTIRQILRRLKSEAFLEQYSYGVYFRPKKQGVMNKAFITAEQISNAKYLLKNGVIQGYETGINLANKLGLTTQTSPFKKIMSNAVANKERQVKIGNATYIINAPRVKVTKENYKLLQILDLLDEYAKHFKEGLEQQKDILVSYFKELPLKKDEVITIIEKYPLRAQVFFYKIGILNCLP
ncbi:MAG TPA: DUF6088 family protein [Bacilli bacterium]|nr:DUF6088 family protein [Bacilli bacterium]